MSNYPAFQIQAVTSLCRNLITMHSASAYRLSYTLLLVNNFIKHTHKLQAQRFVRSVYFEVPYAAAATSAHPSPYSASVLHSPSLAGL